MVNNQDCRDSIKQLEIEGGTGKKDTENILTCSKSKSMTHVKGLQGVFGQKEIMNLTEL